MILRQVNYKAKHVLSKPVPWLIIYSLALMLIDMYNGSVEYNIDYRSITSTWSGCHWLLDAESWCRNDIKPLLALSVIYKGKSRLTSEFLSQRASNEIFFFVFFVVILNKL